MPATPKKRGRPRIHKEPKQEKPKKKVSTKSEDIILHLPIHAKDLKKQKLKVTKEVSEEEIDSEDEIFTLSEFGESSDDRCKKCQKMAEQIKILEKQVLESKLDRGSSGQMERKSYKVDLKLINMETGKPVKKKPNISCWWCTYPFDNQPCYLPEKYSSEKYYVVGCYCSYNCASAYNFSINDMKVWERNTLLKQLYDEVIDNDRQLIPAPSNKLLERFGGPLTIEEFRKSFLVHKKEYRYIFPPMAPLVPIIEEDYRDSIISTLQHGELRIKRTKPLVNKNMSLIDMMKKNASGHKKKK
jgi:hypothetical protein